MFRTSDSRWFAVGSSCNPNSLRAGEEAALRALPESDAKLVVVFSSDDHDAQAVLSGVSAVSRGTALIGATTAGELVTDGTCDGGVVVTALGGDGFEVATAVATDIRDRQREAGIEVAACAEEVGERLPGGNQVLLALPDGLVSGHRHLLRGIYSVLGAEVPLVGGCAGDNMRMRRTWQFHGDQVHTDSVVAAGLASTAPIGIGIRHGWHQISDFLTVTKTSGRRLLAIDDEPALDLYLRRLDAPSAAYSDLEAFVDFAAVHPLGTNYLSGGAEMRFILGADFSAHALILTADIDYGTLLWLSSGDASTTLQATEDACREAIDSLGGRQPIGLIAFDCVSRRRILGKGGTGEEIRRIEKASSGTPFSGFYTYGEIARVKGINGYHNQTFVVLAVS